MRQLRKALEGTLRAKRAKEQSEFDIMKRIGLTYGNKHWTMSGQAHAFYELKK